MRERGLGPQPSETIERHGAHGDPASLPEQVCPRCGAFVEASSVCDTCGYALVDTGAGTPRTPAT